MILAEYEETREMREKTAKAILLSLIKPFIVLLPFCLVAAAFYLFIKIRFDPEDLAFAIAVVSFCFVFFVGLWVFLYFSYKRQLCNGFEFQSENGVAKCVISKEGTTYELRNLTKDTNSKFDRAQIKSAKQVGDFLFVTLRNRLTVIFPALPGLTDEFLPKNRR